MACKDKLCLVFLILLCLSETLCREVTRTEKIVTTGVGEIQGELDSDRGYYKFLGIPYGQVSQRNPFGESTQYPRFDNVFQANDDSVVCPQMLNGEVLGSSDCLNLHVYVPTSATATSQHPVIIWIHGGYFMRGRSIESVLGPKFLVRHDVIFVAVNYRVGPFGFMCLGINEIPGNQGLKDQQLALEWIHEHIAAFGGNPNQLTLAGNSAGAHSIDLHLISERDRVFNRIIMQSGSSLTATVFTEPDRRAAVRIAQQLEFTTNSSREAVLFLSTRMDAHSIIRAANELNMEFKPCVETDFEGANPFIARNWVNASVEKVRSVPVLIGFSEYERMSYHINQDLEHFENMDIFTQRLNHVFRFNDAERFAKMEDIVRRFYMGDSVASPDTVWPIINFDSDIVYNHPIQRSIKKYLASGSGNIFYYMFAYSGGRNRHVDQNNVPIEVASHNDELAYLFELSRLTEEVSPADQQMIDKMTTMWTNFAKYGNPTPQITDLLPIQWTPLTNEIYHYMRIDSELSMGRRPFNKRMAFFDLFYKYNNDYQRVYDDLYFEYDDFEEDSGTMYPASLMTLLSALLLLVMFRQ